MLINRKKYKNKKVQHMYNIYTSFVKDRKQEKKMKKRYRARAPKWHRKGAEKGYVVVVT